MSASDLIAAKREAEQARRRLAATAAELQQRLKPGTLASNAWSGVKDKSGEMADGAVEAVKARPVPVAAALTAFTLFLARAPLKAAVSRLFSDGGDDEDLPPSEPAAATKITTRRRRSPPGPVKEQ